MEAQTIASELNKVGFKTKVLTGIIRSTVRVTLQNRKVSRMEVVTALEEIFETSFEVRSTSDGVIIFA